MHPALKARRFTNAEEGQDCRRQKVSSPGRDTCTPGEQREINSCGDLPGFENLAGLVASSPFLSPWSKSLPALLYPTRQREINLANSYRAV